MRTQFVAAATAVAALGAAQAAQASEVVVAKGNVENANGQVRAYAWSADRTGPSTRTMPLVATGTADPSGNFTLTATDPERLAKLAGPKGSVDLVVLAPTPSGWTETVFSTAVEQTQDGPKAKATTSGAEAVPTIDLNPLAPRGSEVQAAHHTCKDWGDVGAPKEQRTRTWKRATVVGELNNAYPDTRASFTYGTSADSQISTGLLVEGQGGWKLEGSTTVSTHRGAAIGPQGVRGPYARRIRSNFWYGKWRISLCPAPNVGSHYWRIKTTGWSGGSSSRRQSGTLSVCYGGNDYEKKHVFVRDTNKAVTWNRGVSVGGVGLNVRSGFSQFVKIEYRFGTQVNRHRLCGSGGADETTAGRIYSGAGRPPT